MRNTIFAVLAAGASFLGMTAHAATLGSVSETSDVFIDGTTTLDFDPTFLGGSIFDLLGELNISFSADLTTGSLLLTDGSVSSILDGTLVDTALITDGGLADDSLSLLFELTSGPTDFAIARFEGDLDGFGLTDFLSDGVFFVDGNLRISGATANNTTPVPLPAGFPLLLGALSLMAVSKKARFRS